MNELPEHGGVSKAVRVARHLHILSITGMRVCAKLLKDEETTEAFAQRLLKNIAQRHRHWRQVHLLDDTFAGTAALVALAVLVPGRQTQVELSALHSLLEAYFGPDCDHERILEFSSQWLGCELGVTLLAGRRLSDSQAALGLALAEPTPRALIARALKDGVSVLEHEPYLSWDPARRELLSKTLKDTRAQKDPKVRLFDPEVGFFHVGCSADLRTSRDVNGRPVLDRDFAVNMRRWRLAACPHCSRVLLQLNP
jgi:hypothetical protein